MQCIFCKGKTKVIDVRKKDGRHYRRRECLECGERFTTYEVNQIHLLNVLEDYLPMRLIDEISNVLAVGYPEQGRNGDSLE
ncbi:hypothetical protein WMZ97_18765 [Lentibacillus sp. N15]|uniref:NrdR family transcriptional regulator n=1 Tax=Lentibacillus songyuanensis TaxID=3136161 RepID=UPI0031BAF4C4